MHLSVVPELSSPVEMRRVHVIAGSRLAEVLRLSLMCRRTRRKKMRLEHLRVEERVATAH
jgi:hypothetical protein